MTSCTAVSLYFEVSIHQSVASIDLTLFIYSNVQTLLRKSFYKVTRCVKKYNWEFKNNIL